MSQQEEIIYAHVSDPRNSLFKSSRKDRAECTTITCSNKDACSLYAQGTCILRQITLLGSSSCPYGRRRVETGLTPKAAKYSAWRAEMAKKYEGVGKLNAPVEHIAIIGDYVWLPFAHMNMNTKAPFLKHSAVFVSGSEFIPKDAFTLETLESIVKFRPQAMMGGEITSYRREQLPKFLKQLSEFDPGLWEQLSRSVPEVLEMIPANDVGRQALLVTLRPGCAVSFGRDTYVWDGEHLVKEDASAPIPLIGIADAAYVRAKPRQNAKVTIARQDQVGPDTKFLS